LFSEKRFTFQTRLNEATQITKHKWGNPLAATAGVDQDQ
jgi:hypothetical protein